MKPLLALCLLALLLSGCASSWKAGDPVPQMSMGKQHDPSTGDSTFTVTGITNPPLHAKDTSLTPSQCAWQAPHDPVRVGDAITCTHANYLMVIHKPSGTTVFSSCGTDPAFCAGNG